MKFRPVCFLVCLAISLAPSFARAATAWDETVNGDLSTLPATPTAINLALGSNVVSATMPGNDLDFLTINVPVGTHFSSLILTGYSGLDEISFIAITNGSVFPEGPVFSYDPTGLLGYTHFGPGYGEIGGDILPELALENFGVPGFTPPLPSGSYAFWIQQEGPADTGYQLDFVVTQVPEPTTLLLLAMAITGLVALRRSR